MEHLLKEQKEGEGPLIERTNSQYEFTDYGDSNHKIPLMLNIIRSNHKNAKTYKS